MPALLKIYRSLTGFGRPLLERLLEKRVIKGKEDASRLNERMGSPVLPRPEGRLAWVHAASVGEAQSALILIEKIHDLMPEINFLVTTGTVTSANVMAKRLPVYAFHQYAPLDHGDWVNRFLDHWSPDSVLWMESELWPNMLGEIKKRQIPAALINARLSDNSYRNWKLARSSVTRLLSGFNIVLAQTEKDARRFRKLGCENVVVTDNLKLSAAPLPYNGDDLSELKSALQGRPVWLYASTHDGEEDLACRMHRDLEVFAPDLLTIIVPRHPDRGNDIAALCSHHNLTACQRSENNRLPGPDDDVYIADTLGELGLFYSLSPIAVIGRSFSRDGGGGHNPIEAAQLGCAVVTGPNIQFQMPLYYSMLEEGAAFQARDEKELLKKLTSLLSDRVALGVAQDKAVEFVSRKSHIVENVIESVMPLLSPPGDHVH